ncbi:MAG: hypothetical protein ACJA01_000886 [Saprospiraceae bacterium]
MRKKVLYAVQATGNGHLSRCMEFYPTMMRYADVDVLLSGIQGDLKLPFPVKHKFHGMGFIFGKQGGIDYWKTAETLRPMRLLLDIWRLDLSPYDIIINDFEPISAYARKWRFPHLECVALSHQASFFSRKIPRPKRKGYLAEFIFKNFAPSTRRLGLHFQNYDENIYTPVIREDIRNVRRNYDKKQVLIYLPSYAEEVLIEKLRPLSDYTFNIFSKHTDTEYSVDNLNIFPVGKPKWMKCLETCSYAIVGAGFQGASEMLYLNKKLLAIPMLAQYEQECNARALEEMGATVTPHIGDNFTEVVRNWLKNALPMDVAFPDHTEELVLKAINSESKAKR